jgi:hypothetical protein
MQSYWQGQFYYHTEWIVYEQQAKHKIFLICWTFHNKPHDYVVEVEVKWFLCCINHYPTTVGIEILKCGLWERLFGQKRLCYEISRYFVENRTEIMQHVLKSAINFRVAYKFLGVFSCLLLGMWIQVFERVSNLQWRHQGERRSNCTNCLPWY